MKCRCSPPCRTIVLWVSVLFCVCGCRDGLSQTIGPIAGTPSQSKRETVRIATVERPPFSFTGSDDLLEGFSVDLMGLIADASDLDTSYTICETYQEMLNEVASGRVDCAVANISITAEREARFDFSHPIFNSSIGILSEGREPSLIAIFLHYGKRLVLPVAILLLLVWIFGILVWYFERGVHPFFDLPFREAMFPVFWWALRSTINNGGWDQEVPKTWQGRVISTCMLLTSLIGITFFIGFVSAEQTVGKLHSRVEGIHELDGRRVGTTEDSANSRFLDTIGIKYRAFSNLDDMYLAFENREVDFLVYDTPMLRYYARRTDGAELLAREYLPQPYGILLPEDSPLIERFNKSLLVIRESGEYDELVDRYF